MKKKNIYEAMKTIVEMTLEGVPNNLILIMADKSTDKGTGEISEFIRIEAEVPRGYDSLSKCRFNVKIPGGKLKLSEEQLEECDFEVTFKMLKISYIDVKGNVYFRADDYTVKKVEG